MSELRQNLVNKEWVAIAAQRGKKPNHILSRIPSHTKPEHPYESNCPFCPGNEEKFGIQEHAKISDSKGIWLVRTIENKFGIFSDFDSCPDRLSPFEREGIYQKYTGCGNHEVVIETRRHDQVIAELSDAEISRILSLYVSRYQVLRKNPNNLIAFIFKNYGVLAGQTQPHSHSQIVGSRVVPQYIRSLFHEAERHFDTYGSCVICDTIVFEKQEGKRVIAENEDYILFVPFAASSEHSTWICPKRHAAGISDLAGAQLDNLARILSDAFGRYQQLIGNPDFNYVFRTAPYSLEDIPFYHWYIEILPRTKISGGFERATRLPVNTILPEESAKLLRECRHEIQK